jgi:hypothetical protein
MDALRRELRLGAAGFLLAGSLLVACAGGDQPRTAPSPPPIDYSILAPCDAPPEAIDVRGVEGLRLPDAAFPTAIHLSGPLTQVDGFLAMTPIEARAHYADETGVEVLLLEDEGFEAEALIADGTHRMYIVVRVICATGSEFAATVGPDAASGPTVPPRPAITEPAGAPAAGS